MLPPEAQLPILNSCCCASETRRGAWTPAGGSTLTSTSTRTIKGVAAGLCVFVIALTVVRIQSASAAALWAEPSLNARRGQVAEPKRGFHSYFHEQAHGYGQHFDGLNHDLPMYRNVSGYGSRFNRSASTTSMEPRRGGTQIGADAKTGVQTTNGTAMARLSPYCQTEIAKCFILEKDMNEPGSLRCSSFLVSVAPWYSGGISAYIWQLFKTFSVHGFIIVFVIRMFEAKIQGKQWTSIAGETSAWTHAFFLSCLFCGWLIVLFSALEAVLLLIGLAYYCVSLHMALSKCTA